MQVSFLIGEGEEYVNLELKGRFHGTRPFFFCSIVQPFPCVHILQVSKRDYMQTPPMPRLSNSFVLPTQIMRM